MRKSFDELVPRDKYSFMGTSGVAYGEGWFIYLVAYTTAPKNMRKDIILVYTSGITADSTIDSSLYDPSMTYVTRELLIKKAGKKKSAWLREKDKGDNFRHLSAKEFKKYETEIMKSVRASTFPKEKIKSLRPRDILFWRPRD